MPRFTPDFLDELKARLRPSDVIGKHVRLKKQGNEWVGLSPFTKEKTPSFFVNDQKGFFHDFSSGKHGDIISFLQETQRLTFYEAVERLAEDAGLPLPAASPGEEARVEQAKGLAEACVAAAGYFQAMLRRSGGRRALDYLAERGVSEDQIAEFGIGFAPNERAGLKDFLINKGFREDTLVEAGLLIKPDDGGASYDRFRGRIMFPITGARDRVIAFGGRALDPNARAKYLNSPETPIFHKGSVLYRLAKARAAGAEDKAAVIVCEGYMDVIALWGAGIGRATAPLGTALTENQLALLWRASEEPVLCFDGDRAGVGAAHRAVDRALPLLKPGKSLRFAFLPQGQDPDDLVRDQGRPAFDAVIKEARPLVDVLWDRERAAQNLDTPERRAALRSHLRELVKTIADNDVREAYGRELARRLEAEFGAGRDGPSRPRGGASPRRFQGRNQGFRYEPPPRPTPALKRIGAPPAWRREGALVLAAIAHPALVERQEAAFLELELEDAGLKALLGEILTAISSDPGLDSDLLKSHLNATGAADTMERVFKDPELSKHRFLRPDAEIDEVEQGFRNALAHHLYESVLKQEVARSASQIFAHGEASWKAAAAAREEMVNANRAIDADTGDGEDHARLEAARERMKQSVAKKFGR
ncbi:MAG: DNA primase [Pseudomonadota bacterium]